LLSAWVHHPVVVIGILRRKVARGVAVAYSAVMAAELVPLVVWAVRGTVIDVRDILWTLLTSR
jgi:hypothetical protein